MLRRRILAAAAEETLDRVEAALKLTQTLQKLAASSLSALWPREYDAQYRKDDLDRVLTKALPFTPI